LLGDPELYRLAVDHTVGRVGQFDEYAVLSGRQPNENDRLQARINEVPLGIIDGHMDVTNPGLDVECRFPEDG
jgi:hypothetical protein